MRDAKNVIQTSNFKHSIRMAIKIKSTSNPISIGEIMKRLYKLFDNYRGRIMFDRNVKGTYLDMARKVLCPEEDLDVDGMYTPP